MPVLGVPTLPRRGASFLRLPHAGSLPQMLSFWALGDLIFCFGRMVAFHVIGSRQGPKEPAGLCRVHSGNSGNEVPARGGAVSVVASEGNRGEELGCPGSLVLLLPDSQGYQSLAKKHNDLLIQSKSQINSKSFFLVEARRVHGLNLH